jgi:hypothetical protein
VRTGEIDQLHQMIVPFRDPALGPESSLKMTEVN